MYWALYRIYRGGLVEGVKNIELRLKPPPTVGLVRIVCTCTYQLALSF